MKNNRIIALALVLVLLMSTLTACGGSSTLQAELDSAKAQVAKLEADLAEAQVYDASKFVTWFEEEGVWRTIANDTTALGGQPGGFVTDASGAPSEEELKAMMHMASLAVTSGGKTDWFMVAVTDPDEQMAIIGDTYGVATSEGTATILIFSERLIRPELRTDENNTYQPDRGYYNTGILTGYLNVAAIAMGYGSHMFMSPALEGVNGFNDGGLGLDCAKYLEGTEYYMASTKQNFSTENMKFVNAVVIGTLDESVESGVTNKEFPDNWVIWEK